MTEKINIEDPYWTEILNDYYDIAADYLDTYFPYLENNSIGPEDAEHMNMAHVILTSILAEAFLRGKHNDQTKETD